MREIKFRALKSGCWHYLILKHPAAIANALLKQWESGEEVVFETPWSQYTGLKDKNGKEIYEGDIVSVVTKALTPPIVKWDNDRAGWHLHCHNRIVGKNCRFRLSKWRKKIEVIGNIYETPELLEGENG